MEQRILRFNVTGQRLLKNDKCNFDGIISESRGYLVCQFVFDATWRATKKIAIFRCLGKEYPAPIVNGRCEIPSEALVWSNFSVSVIGQDKEGSRIRTNSVIVRQEVG